MGGKVNDLLLLLAPPRVGLLKDEYLNKKAIKYIANAIQKMFR